MTPEKLREIKRVLDAVRFRDWTFYLGTYMGGPAYLQVQFPAPDNDDPAGPPVIQKGRKHLLSEHMTTSEIVQTAWLAVQVATEHELREQFTYEGRAVFGPHFDVRFLVDLVEKEAFDHRPAAVTPPDSAPPAVMEMKPAAPPPAVRLTRETLTPARVRESLEAFSCPACPAPKSPGDHVCAACWHRLPQPNQYALAVSHVGHGYEDALFDALQFLGVGTLHTASVEADSKSV